jgi:hypothetical protein
MHRIENDASLLAPLFRLSGIRVGHRHQGDFIRLLLFLQNKDIRLTNGFVGNCVRVCAVNSAGSGQRPMAGSCEHGHEPFDAINDVKFLEQLSDYWYL